MARILYQNGSGLTSATHSTNNMSKLPTPATPIYNNTTYILQQTGNNSSLTTKQKKTLNSLINIHNSSIPHNIDTYINVFVDTDTFTPAIKYNIYNKNHCPLNTLYNRISINIPLDFPSKSSLIFTGRKKTSILRGSFIDIDTNIPDVKIQFNANNIKHWFNILHLIRPLLTHNSNIIKTDDYTLHRLPT